MKPINEYKANPWAGLGGTRSTLHTLPTTAGGRRECAGASGPIFAAPGERLDKQGKALPGVSADTAEARRHRRKTRHSRRAYLWKNSTLRSVQGCGRSVIGGTVGVRLASTGIASVAGLQTCGSHACPVCSARIAHERKTELAAAVTAWEKKGGHLMLLTLTMRHHQGNHLGDMWDALSYAWGAVSSGRNWISEKTDYGLAGSVRAVELMVKQGSSGTWATSDEHLHTHILLFVDRQLTELERAGWESSIVGRWTRALERKGLTALPIGQDLRPITAHSTALADYLNKSFDSGEAVGFEMTHGATKTAKKLGSRPPFAVLDEAIQGDDLALKWWRRYEKIQRGRRRLLWSYGLRDLLELEAERTDEEIAAEELGGVEDTVIVLMPDQWKKLVSVPWRVPKLLDVLEKHGVARAMARLDSWGITHLAPPPLL